MRAASTYLIALVPVIELLWMIVFYDYIPMWGWVERSTMDRPFPDDPDGGMPIEAGGRTPVGLNFSIFRGRVSPLC
jgi:hypothetical protein